VGLVLAARIRFFTSNPGRGLLFKVLQKFQTGVIEQGRGSQTQDDHAGSTNMDIAHALSISEDMVKRHLTHIFDKVGVSNRLELGLFAVHHHLVTLDLCGLPPPPTFV
jgi:hypothetical protein